VRGAAGGGRVGGVSEREGCSGRGGARPGRQFGRGAGRRRARAGHAPSPTGFSIFWYLQGRRGGERGRGGGAAGVRTGAPASLGPGGAAQPRAAPQRARALRQRALCARTWPGCPSRQWHACCLRTWCAGRRGKAARRRERPRERMMMYKISLFHHPPWFWLRFPSHRRAPPPAAALPGGSLTLLLGCSQRTPPLRSPVPPPPSAPRPRQCFQ
jgi:hypothetical protein